MMALIKQSKGHNNVALTKFPKPKVNLDEVLIKVSYAGICGTDIHCFTGSYDRLYPPIILGHEFAGTVIEVGNAVQKIKVGDLVVSETTYKTCDQCQACLDKEYNLCINRYGLGTRANGGFAEYVLSREESVHKLPQNVSLLAAAITEPFACVVHAALEKVKLQADQTVVIIGLGTIGLALLQIVKTLNVTVIILGLNKDKPKFELAKELGADHIVNIEEENPVTVIQKLTNGLGADFCFECSGAANSLKNILAYLKVKGTLVQMGVFSQAYNPLDLNSIVQKEINIVGSRSQKPSSWIKTLDILGKGLIKPEKLITAIYPLNEWHKAFNAVMSGNEIKVVLKI